MPTPGRRKPIPKVRVTKKPRLDLRIAKGFDAIAERIPRGALSEANQNILRRIQDIHRKVMPGRLTEADYNNMKRIAKAFGIKL